MFGQLLKLISVAAVAAIGVLVMLNHPHAVDEDGILRNPPSCSMDGKEVYYYKATNKQLSEFGAGIAMAIIDDLGTPWILVDRENLGKFSIQFQYWMLRHECNHHTLGHTKVSFKALANTDEPVERNADCGAISDAIKSGFTDEDFEILFSDIGNKELLREAMKNIKPTKYSSLNHDWTLEERVRYNKQCFTKLRKKES